MPRALWFYPIFFPFTVFCLLTAIVLSFFGADRVHGWARFWARCCLRLGGVRLEVHGREHLDPGQPVICMANHSSNFDILVLFAGLPIQFRWLAKEELFRIPLFGFTMRRSGYISVDRSDRKKAIASMAIAARRIAAGVPVAIFPEGTRSPDGKLLPFKKGGFMLALDAQVPIAPVAIVGAHAVMPKHSWLIHGGTIHLHILPPLATAGKGAVERDQLIEEVRSAIATVLSAATN